MRVLIVEDEPKLRNSLSRGLQEAGYIVHQAADGAEGLALAEANEYAVLVLDVALPGLDGYTVCRRLRTRGSGTPVLMLTARDTVEDRVQGLDCGADDYLVKPFAFAELLARIRALRRRESGQRSPVLKMADLTLDTVTREVHRSGKPIALSSREFTMLEYFMRHPGQVLTRDMIAEHVWDFSFEPGSNVIDVYIRYLRRKLDDGFEPRLLHTVRGAGYRLSAGEPVTAAGRE